MKTPFEAAIEYHERSKHYPGRYARSPRSMDWANEPDPFRRYEGTELLMLPLLEKDPEANHFDLYSRKKNRFRPVTAESIGAFLELSLGLSAWKSYNGSSWALRMNPSSGNLHPTEAYLILPGLAGIRGGVFHYDPFHHGLERRAESDERLWQAIGDHFRREGFLCALSTIYWREAWKYGERAFRYCHQDIGHAVSCISLSANLMGWKAEYLNSLSGRDMEILLGFGGIKWEEQEREEPVLVCFIGREKEEKLPKSIPPEIIRAFESLRFSGTPNILSRKHMTWPVIDEVASHTMKPGTEERRCSFKEDEYLEKEIAQAKAAETIRRRRSALAFDGKTYITREEFLAMLDKTTPRSRCAPFDLEVCETSVHLLLFVHRVKGLDPGLYFLIRNADDLAMIKKSCRKDFLWERVDASTHLDLYLLREEDFRDIAMLAGCDQEIAAEGAFSVGMIAKFKERIEKLAHAYRELHWEAGMIGQVLYLEAEAHRVRGTGMGCFFDDIDHEILGFEDNSFQSVYHFSVGGPVEDKRITTLAPYRHPA